MTPAERLKAALDGKDREALTGLADASGVSLKIVRMAARGRAVSVDHHLRMAAALGFDPYFEGRPLAPFALGRFNRGEFGATVRRYRKDDRRLGITAAAKVIGISLRGLSFIENGKPVCIETTMTVCRFIGIHPFAFALTHSTGNSECKGLIEKDAA